MICPMCPFTYWLILSTMFVLFFGLAGVILWMQITSTRLPTKWRVTLGAVFGLSLILSEVPRAPSWPMTLLLVFVSTSTFGLVMTDLVVSDRKKRDAR